MHQVFSVHTASEKFENATIGGHFGFVLEETLAVKSNDDYRDVIVLENSVFKLFSVYILKRKAGVLKFLRFVEHF